MPLIQDPDSHSRATLEELRRSLREDLASTAEMLRDPSVHVRDPASIETAEELLRGTLDRLDRPGGGENSDLAVDINLAYATLLAVVDIAKSHTDLPRVPRKRSPG